MSDTAHPTGLSAPGAAETVLVADIVHAAHGLGVRHLPEADRLVTGRVWPGGHGWVGEVGDGTTIRALDDVYESILDAIKAVDTEIRRLRDSVVTTLQAGGEHAAGLAASRDNWQPPVLKVFADAAQQTPWLLQLSM